MDMAISTICNTGGSCVHGHKFIINTFMIFQKRVSILSMLKIMVIQGIILHLAQDPRYDLQMSALGCVILQLLQELNHLNQNNVSCNNKKFSEKISRIYHKAISKNYHIISFLNAQNLIHIVMVRSTTQAQASLHRTILGNSYQQPQDLAFS